MAVDVDYWILLRHLLLHRFLLDHLLNLWWLLNLGWLFWLVGVLILANFLPLPSPRFLLALPSSLLHILLLPTRLVGGGSRHELLGDLLALLGWTLLELLL